MLIGVLPVVRPVGGIAIARPILHLFPDQY